MEPKLFLFMCLCAAQLHLCFTRRYHRRWFYRRSWSRSNHARSSHYQSASSYGQGLESIAVGRPASPCNSASNCYCCKWESKSDECFNTICTESQNGRCVRTERQIRDGCSLSTTRVCTSCCKNAYTHGAVSCAVAQPVGMSRSPRGVCCGQTAVVKAWCCMGVSSSSCCLGNLLTTEEMIAAQVQAEHLARVRVAQEAASLERLRTQRAAEQAELARLAALQLQREAEAREAADLAAIQAARAAELRETQARLSALTAQRQLNLATRQEALRQAEQARALAAETNSRLTALREQREAELAAQREAHRQAELAATAQQARLAELWAEETAARERADRAQTERDAALAAQSSQAVQLQAQQVAASDAQREAGRLALIAAQRMCGSCGSPATARAGCCSGRAEPVVVTTCCGGAVAVMTACCSAASHNGQIPACCGTGAPSPVRTAMTAVQRSNVCCGISNVARLTCCDSISRMSTCC